MRITSVLIQNFRGIKDLELSFGQVTVLIGENNSGKTSILDAVKICLGGLGGRRRAIFNEMDFHLPNEDAEPSSVKPVRIVATFLEDTRGMWDDRLVGRLSRAGVLQFREDEKRYVSLQVECSYDQETREFSDQWSFLDPMGAVLSVELSRGLRILREELKYYYLTALRDAGRHFDAHGPFWRPFLRDSQLSVKKKSEIEEHLKKVNNLIISSHSSFEQVKVKLQELRSFVLLANEDPVSIEAVPSRMFEILSKAEVQIGTNTGAKIPLARHGEGTQSLAVLLLFFAFLESQREGASILALEEPEAHLHPSAIRSLWRLVQNFANQQIVSTHSGDLISETNISDIRRLARTSDGIKAFHISEGSLSDEEIRKFNYSIRRTRGELLFARCWLLVEGQTEIWVYEAAARACNMKLHEEGVRLLEYQQAGAGPAMLAKIANLLGIVWYCVGDKDGNGSSLIRKKRDLREFFNGDREEDRLVFPYENLEEHLAGNGFHEIYWNYIPNHKKKEIPNTPENYIEIVQNFRKSHKTKAAHDIAIELEEHGESKVTMEIRSVLEKTLSLARR